MNKIISIINYVIDKRRLSKIVGLIILLALVVVVIVKDCSIECGNKKIKTDTKLDVFKKQGGTLQPPAQR